MPTNTNPRLLLESVDGVTVVTFAEKSLLSGQTIQEVAAEMKLIDGLLSSKVLINFDGVEYLSSALLAELFWLQGRIDAAGGQTKLCCIRPDLIEVFSATGFDRKFEIFDNEYRALDSF
jgi:anti-sigma B factor antagonist